MRSCRRSRWPTHPWRTTIRSSPGLCRRPRAPSWRLAPTSVAGPAASRLRAFESPELALFLRQRFGSGTEASIERPTVSTGYRARLDLPAWEVQLFEGQEPVATFPLVPMGAAAQELVACGGIEPWIRRQLASERAADSTGARGDLGA